MEASLDLSQHKYHEAKWLPAGWGLWEALAPTIDSGDVAAVFWFCFVSGGGALTVSSSCLGFQFLEFGAMVLSHSLRLCGRRGE